MSNYWPSVHNENSASIQFQNATIFLDHKNTQTCWNSNYMLNYILNKLNTLESHDIMFSSIISHEDPILDTSNMSKFRKKYLIFWFRCQTCYQTICQLVIVSHTNQFTPTSETHNYRSVCKKVILKQQKEII